MDILLTSHSEVFSIQKTVTGVRLSWFTHLDLSNFTHISLVSFKALPLQVSGFGRVTCNLVKSDVLNPYSDLYHTYRPKDPIPSYKLALDRTSTDVISFHLRNFTLQDSSDVAIVLRFSNESEILT